MGLFDNLREKYIVQPVVKSFNETIKGGSVAKLGNDTNMTPTNDPVSWNVPYNYNAQYFNKCKSRYIQLVLHLRANPSISLV